MTTRERIVEELNGLSQAELEQVAHYLELVKTQFAADAKNGFDETRLAALYAEFAGEDRELAEQGLSDYATALVKEDSE